MRLQTGLRISHDRDPGRSHRRVRSTAFADCPGHEPIGRLVADARRAAQTSPQEAQVREAQEEGQDEGESLQASPRLQAVIAKRRDFPHTQMLMLLYEAADA